MRNHQRLAFNRLRQVHKKFSGLKILEIASNSSSEAILPFVEQGYARAVVTGLRHITQQKNGSSSSFKLVEVDLYDLVDAYGEKSFDIVFSLSCL